MASLILNNKGEWIWDTPVGDQYDPNDPSQNGDVAAPISPNPGPYDVIVNPYPQPGGAQPGGGDGTGPYSPWNDWWKGGPLVGPDGTVYGGGGEEEAGGGEGGAGGNDFGLAFPSHPGYGRAPMFKAPQFHYDQKFYAPDFEEMKNDPGYRFRVSEGQRALEQSAAGRGSLNSGGTLKDLDAFTQNFASQEYGNVFNRDLQSYMTNYGVARDIFDRLYTGAKDEFAPKLYEWGTNARAADISYAAMLQKWFHDTLSAADILHYGENQG